MCCVFKVNVDVDFGLFHNYLLVGVHATGPRSAFFRLCLFKEIHALAGTNACRTTNVFLLCVLALGVFSKYS